MTGSEFGTSEGTSLKCPQCGLINPAGAQSCDCGYDFITRTWIAPQRSYPTQTDPLQGVGGWLLLFCISTTILAPLVLIITPLATALNSLWLATFGAMNVVSVYTGVALWRVASNALKWARIYFAVCLGVECLELLVASLRAGPPIITQGGALAGMAGTLVWLAYFIKSKRVRATFGSNLRGPKWL